MESKVEGNARVVFGGKIGVGTTLKISGNETTSSIFFGELNREYEIGCEDLDDTDKKADGDKKVELIFTDPRSVDIVIKYLQEIRTNLKIFENS